MEEQLVGIEIPGAEWDQLVLTLSTAQASAEAGFVGVASCLLVAARRRVERAAAAGEPWAPALKQLWELAHARFSERYGTLD